MHRLLLLLVHFHALFRDIQEIAHQRVSLLSHLIYVVGLDFIRIPAFVSNELKLTLYFSH